MHMFNVSTLYLKAKYQIVLTKTVVEVDRPKALSMHIREKLSKFSQLSFCPKKILNQTPSCICSICLHCKGKVSNCSIKSCGRS